MSRRELSIQLDNFKEIYDHIEALLEEGRVDDRGRTETMLVFEALYGDLLARGIPGDTMLRVQRSGSFGDVNIRIKFEGRPYVPMSGSEEDFTIEDRFMQAYAEKIAHRYEGGCNILTLTTRRSPVGAVRNSMIAILLAIVSYVIISRAMGGSEQTELISNVLLHAEGLFTNAILSVGAPVTFFSLLRNLTNMYVIGEGDAPMRRIQAGAIGSSAIAAALAVCVSLVLAIPMQSVYYGIIGLLGGVRPEQMDIGISLIEMFDSLVSSNIFEPFVTFSPFPIILLAILTTYALCSAGNYLEEIKKVVDGCYVLFSRMLTAVMYVLPLFCFLAMLEGMLRLGPGLALFMICLAVIVTASLVVMVLFYSVRLGVSGIQPGPFFSKLLPLIRENLLINSTIDAVPFNTRYCVTEYKIGRKKLEEYLPLLAQINLDGNCFIVTLIALLLMIISGTSITWFSVIVVGMIVFFLSLGAPNQPGSILIGLLVIFSYMNALDMVAMAICAEAIFGGLVSITNAAGDIVTVMIADRKYK